MTSDCNSASAPGTLILPDHRLNESDVFVNAAYVGDRMLMIDASCRCALIETSQIDLLLQHITVVVPSSC